jgi:hypothetical protein
MKSLSQHVILWGLLLQNAHEPYFVLPARWTDGHADLLNYRFSHGCSQRYS